MAASDAGSVFSDRVFRDTLGLFATGVVVVTCTARNRERFGATVSSFSSVSLNPPLILFSIGRNTHAFAAWEATDNFAVNVLAEDQSTVSTRFARALTDKWEGLDTDADINGSPILPGTLAWLSCTSYAKYDGGDHLIVVGRVDALTSPRLADPRPLVFFAGKYRRLDSDHPIQTPPDTSEWLHGW